MAASSKQISKLLDKLDQLPPERLSEVEDFVDFLVSKSRDKAFGEFLSTADEVAKANLPVMSAEEVEAEIKAYRDERRSAARS